MPLIPDPERELEYVLGTPRHGAGATREQRGATQSTHVRIIVCVFPCGQTRHAIAPWA